MWSSKDHFCYLWVSLPGNIFANISAKTKYFSKKFWGIAQGPREYRFMQKTRHQKFYFKCTFLNFKKAFSFLHQQPSFTYFIVNPCKKTTKSTKVICGDFCGEKGVGPLCEYAGEGWAEQRPGEALPPGDGAGHLSDQPTRGVQVLFNGESNEIFYSRFFLAMTSSCPFRGIPWNNFEGRKKILVEIFKLETDYPV